MRYVKLLIILIGIATLAGCVEEKTKMANITFGQDLSFLKKHTDVFIIEDKSGNSKVAVLPALQGRAMTSTAEGLEGLSFGWINRELVASGETVEHINVYGGEDRFWIGPEGGQQDDQHRGRSLEKRKRTSFNMDTWYVQSIAYNDDCRSV